MSGLRSGYAVGAPADVPSSSGPRRRL